MKTISRLSATVGIFSIFLALLFKSNADTILMATGRTISGIALQTNEEDILILTDFAAFNFSRTTIKGIESDPANQPVATEPARIPTFHDTVLHLSTEAWANNLTPVPATVIDKGILRHVPYSSFHCGGDYEVNVYGDPQQPAGIEIGVYRKLSGDAQAKQNCLQFIESILGDQSDRALLHALNLSKDVLTHNGLTIEITPPTDEDAYNGWWISVYSEKQLNLARATESEMQHISMTKADAEKNAKDSANDESWSATDLKRARPSNPRTFSFRTSSGVLITNAEVVRIVDGVKLIWRSGPTTSGMVKIEDLPDDLRTRFGYDAVKSKAADDSEASDKARWQQEANQMAQAAAPSQTVAADPYSATVNSYGNNRDYSGGGGMVYVHGYCRSNGTYVNSYHRSSPHSR